MLVAQWLLAWPTYCCCYCCTRVTWQEAIVAAVLYDAAHEAAAFIVRLCTSKCISQEVATLHQLDMLLHDASALSVAVLQLPVLSLQEKQHNSDC